MGIKVEVGEEIQYGKQGFYATVGDDDHAKIVEMYAEGKSFAEISSELSRAKSTVHAQVHAHNQAIHRIGFCARCKQVKSEASSRRAVSQRMEEAARARSV